MNVSPAITTVMWMPPVPTPLAHIIVHVRKDLLEMDACAQVPCQPIEMFHFNGSVLTSLLFTIELYYWRSLLCLKRDNFPSRLNQLFGIFKTKICQKLWIDSDRMKNRQIFSIDYTRYFTVLFSNAESWICRRAIQFVKYCSIMSEKGKGRWCRLASTIYGKFIAIFVNQIQLYMLKVKRLCEIKPTMSRAVLSLSEAKSQACTYKNHWIELWSSNGVSVLTGRVKSENKVTSKFTPCLHSF